MAEETSTCFGGGVCELPTDSRLGDLSDRFLGAGDLDCLRDEFLSGGILRFLPREEELAVEERRERRSESLDELLRAFLDKDFLT
jgi:hypothetical protein